MYWSCRGKIHLQSLEEQRNLPGQHLFLLANHDQDRVVEVLGGAVHVHPHGVHLRARAEREEMQITHARTRTDMLHHSCHLKLWKTLIHTFAADHRYSKYPSCLLLIHIVTILSFNTDCTMKSPGEIKKKTDAWVQPSEFWFKLSWVKPNYGGFKWQAEEFELGGQHKIRRISPNRKRKRLMCFSSYLNINAKYLKKIPTSASVANKL